MARRASLAVTWAAASLAIGAALPLAAQSSEGQGKAQSPGVRIVTTPEYGTVYVMQEQPKDIRTPRQRCVDEEVAAAGGSPSQLAVRAIDLKCSQR